MRKGELRAKIEAAGFDSQVAFARHLGLDTGTVSRWTRGVVPVPHAIHLLLDALIALRQRQNR